jgi:energy-coupling factor transporter ATP-binding protein EcfA2
MSFLYDERIDVEKTFTDNGVTVQRAFDSYETHARSAGSAASQRVDVYAEAKDCFDTGDSLLITGPGGSGKTQLIVAIVHAALVRNKTVWVTATTGVAAQNITRAVHAAHPELSTVIATTVHSRLHLKPNDEKRPIAALKATRESEERAREAQRRRDKRPYKRPELPDVIIVDEVSMVTKLLMDCLLALFPFAQFAFVGDAYQLPPVNIEDGYFFQSQAFAECVKDNMFALNKRFRMSDEDSEENRKWNDMLAHMRSTGTLLASHINMLERTGPLYHDAACSDDDDDTVTHVCATNAAVDAHNNTVLLECAESNGGAMVTFNAVATRERCVGDEPPVPVETVSAALEKRTAEVLAQQTSLNITVGARVILIQNAGDGRHFNGSTGNVVDVFQDPEDPMQDTVTVVFDADEGALTKTGRKKKNNPVVVKRVSVWNGDERVNASARGCDRFTTKVCALPLKLSWALTVHRLQGITVNNKLEASMRGTEKQTGMAYVLLTRPSNASAVRLTDVACLEGQTLFSPEVLKFNAVVVQCEQRRREQVAIALASSYASSAEDDFYKSVPGYEPWHQNPKEYIVKTFNRYEKYCADVSAAKRLRLCAQDGEDGVE